VSGARKDLKNRISTMTLVLCLLSCIVSASEAPLPSSATASAVEEKLETWADNHPRAAAELGEWVTLNRDAARKLFKWDAVHPEQSTTFVTWIITHQGKGIDAFTAQHTDWSRFNEIIKEYRSAIGDFIVWCRFHPKASMKLMLHPRALHWVGRHLYESSLKLTVQ
jgi:hypothetical protein